MFVTTANFPIQDETYYIPNGKLSRDDVVDVIDLIKRIIKLYGRAHVYDLTGAITTFGETKYEFAEGMDAETYAPHNVYHMVCNGWRSAKFWIPIYIPKKGWHIMMPKPKNLY